MNDDTAMPDASNQGGHKRYQRWLLQKMTTNDSLRKNPAAASFLREFLNNIQTYHVKHGNQVLQCRGQQRSLVSPAPASSSSSSSSLVTADWFDFLQISDRERHSGPFLEEASSSSSNTTKRRRRRFETISLKVQASRDKIRFGMTDDTGYLFPCLQHFVPRACFLVIDHYQPPQNNNNINSKHIFIIHGNKKFAGQGDDASEEEGTSAVADKTINSATDLHNPPPKCFPGTAHLQPSYYIFTWKANGKNAGVFGYKDPYQNNSNGQNNSNVWLFVNSKGVCECAGLLNDIVKDPQQAEHNWSDTVREEPRETCLLANIFNSFCDIWNYPGRIDQNVILSLWERGYLLLFEFCDNKHVVLERGDGGRPVDHLAFIGLVQQPPLYTTGTYSSGLVFNIDNQFTFDWWRRTVQAPSFSSKPTHYVKAADRERALQDVMKGTFFRNPESCMEENDAQSWFNPNSQLASSAFVTGEGAVCYEMATSEGGKEIIRQLFKAKTASYITHRQFRAFLSRKNHGAESTFEEYSERVKKFCRQKMGDLTASPYPDVRTFCQDSPSLVVEASSMFYTHFGMWLQQIASKLQTTDTSLVNFMSPDIQVSLESNVGKEYLLIMELLKLPIQPGQTTLRIRCGMAFRVAEFTQIYDLQHASVFAAPTMMIQRIKALEDATSTPSFSWKTMPTGYSGFLRVGFQHAFPDGTAPKPELDKEQKKKRKLEKKKQKGKRDDVLAPFRTTFSRFLLANPAVKLTLGRDDPLLFTFTSGREETTLLSCETVEELLEHFLRLPSLSRPEHSKKENERQRTLPEAEALAQACSVLKGAFPVVQDLFQKPTNLSFGDVSGRLVPILTGNSPKSCMLIIRGFPGLGKSTVAKTLQHLFGKARVPVIEADSFFGTHCQFNPELLPVAHEDAQARARAALQDSSTELIVVSNTNIMAWEYASYIRIAQNCSTPVSVAILTLDTEASFGEIDNIHEVPFEQVKKMAMRMRQADNNPEGKTLEEILTIADAQTLKFKSASTPVLAWTLLEREGKSTVADLWEAFLGFCSSQNILVSSSVYFQPELFHVTQLFVRPGAPAEEMMAASRLWDQRGNRQSIKLGDILFRTVMEGNQRRFVNMAVCVVSLSPELVAIKTPHITIAYDPDLASAFDSNKLWLSEAGEDMDEKNAFTSVTVFDCQPKQTEFSGIIDIGTYKDHAIQHEQRLPSWLKTASAPQSRSQPQGMNMKTSGKPLLFTTLMLLVLPSFSNGSSNGSSRKASVQQHGKAPSFSLDTEAGLSQSQPAFWSFDDDDDDDGDDGGDSSSDSDVDGWVPFGYPASPWDASAASMGQVHKPKGTINSNQRSSSVKPSGSTVRKNRSPSQPMQTLEKLQQMLDETDYLTSRQQQEQQRQQQQYPGQSSSHHQLDLLDELSDPPPLPSDQPDLPAATEFIDHSSIPTEPRPPPPPQHQEQMVSHPTSSRESQLWTSKDRSKYKRQQKRLQKKGSDKHDDDPSDTEDGLEYTLPNLPVYLSDTEGDSDVEDLIHQRRQGPLRQHVQPPPRPPRSGTILRPEQTGYYSPPPPPPQASYAVPHYPQETYPTTPQASHQGSGVPPPNQYGYTYPPPPFNGPYDPQNNQGQQQHFYAAQQHYAAWAAAMGYVPAPQYGPVPPQTRAKLPPSSKNSGISATKPDPASQYPSIQAVVPAHQPLATSLTQQLPQQEQQLGSQYDVTITLQSRSLAEATSRINFDSIQKMSFILGTAAMACYASVSPRSLAPTEYNRLFYNNVRILSLTLIAPLITFFSVFDVKENDLNEIIHSLYTSFSLGYILCFGLEVLYTTLIRLSVFLCFEPEIFDLVPKIPVVVLPWVLREVKYRPQRITIVLADVLTSCVACPLIEEYVKLKILQWTTSLPKNYLWVKKAKSPPSNSSGGKKKDKKQKWKREKTVQRPGEKEVTTVNKYITQMLAVSIGLKIADNGRRVLMYTKPHHADKSFYAICRGIFPIHELCGTMTALRLAKRDVLGAELSNFWILFPAVVVHGMANLRGKKGIFKWNSATPWSEMQLLPWSSTDASTLPQLASKGFSKLMWLIILLRVLGYCAKNYYYTNRQAEKRTTTYAGNPSAIDAALASSDLLKKTQKK